MRRARLAAALAGSAAALGAVLVSAPAASAQGTIWAECTSGSVTQTCQESSWYTAPVAVVWRASPSPEETSPCLLGIEYPFEADNVATIACSARWKTEGSDRRELTLHIEVSSPSGEALAERPPDSGGWYNHPVAVSFKGHGYSGSATCRTGGSSASATYSGPDALSASVSATCTDPAGKSVTPSFSLRYDATPPSITGALAVRPPDFGGWYNHPVTYVFTGSDALSGMEPCAATYAGPDSDDAVLTGVCRDRAGNVATLAVALRYHATPPDLSVRAAPGDGLVSLRWRANSRVEITRSPGLRGSHPSRLYEGAAGVFADTRCRDGVTYTYTLKAKDPAGNVTKRSVSVTPGPQLLSPGASAIVTTPPLLRWTAVRGANYYNVQLFRAHGGKVLSTWPVHPALQLSRAWRYGGREYHLSPGRYTWYVWPGVGPFGAAHYGALIGRRTFTVR